MVSEERNSIATELIGQLSTIVGQSLESDVPLFDIEIESIDLVEWLISIEDRYGITLKDEAFKDLDLEWSVMQACTWLAGLMPQGPSERS